jgi:hypothetical protein
MVNPFQVTKPVDPSEVIDRETEDANLRALAEEGNNGRLVAPRRYGKTSLLRRSQVRLADDDWLTVYVDLLGVVTMNDFAARVERAYISQLNGTVAKWFMALRRTLKPTLTIGGGPVPASGSVDLSGQAKEALIERLDLPAKVAEKTGKRVHVVYDEFQELDALEDNTDAVVRSVIQHHGDAASYVFAGSHVHMMEMMFTDRRRAFYGQTQRVALNPLDAVSLGTYIVERFAQTGKEVAPAALDELLGLVEGHPQRAMVVAHALWDATDSLADLLEWDAARVAVMDSVDDELKAAWLDLAVPERQLLTTLAHGKSPYHRGGVGQRGGGVQRALDGLEKRGTLAQTEGKWRMVDPLLAEWVRNQRAGL